MNTIVIFSKQAKFGYFFIDKLEKGSQVLCFSSLENAREVSKFCNPDEIVLDIHSLRKEELDLLSKWPTALIKKTVIATYDVPVKREEMRAGIYRFVISELQNEQLVVGNRSVN